jgi:hypothetical protein
MLVAAAALVELVVDMLQELSAPMMIYSAAPFIG